MRRLLFLAYYFPPIGGGGVQRAVKIVRYLPENGWQPVVVTGPGGADNEWAPADETLAGELPAEAEIVRIAQAEPPLSTGLSGRLSRLLEVPSPFQRWWVRNAYAHGRAQPDLDVVVGELVPYYTAGAAARIAQERGLPWIADLQDPWALDEMWLYPSAAHRRLDLRRMRRLLRTAAAIVMNTPEAAVRLTARFPELAEKIVVSIPNGFDSSDFPPAPPPRDDGKVRIVHTGYFHTELGLRQRGRRRFLGGAPVPEVDILTRSPVHLLAAIDRLLARDPSLRDVLEVRFAGVLSEADVALARRSPVVRLHGYLPHDETVALLQSADLLFLPMHDLPPGTRAGLVPGKTYEYLGSGRPILAAVPDGDARELLEEAGSALLCRPSDVDAMARLVADAVGRVHAGERAAPPPRPDVLARYERRRQTAELAATLDAVLERERSLSPWPARRLPSRAPAG